MHRLLPGIVSVAAILCACGGAGSPPSNATSSAVDASVPTNEPAAPSASSASSASTPSSGARKRTRAAPPAASSPDGTKPKNGRALNARDNLGRTVFVRADDHCFVEVAPKEKPAPDAPPARATEVVDCPQATDDPAWDHCAAQIVLDESGSKCFCVTGAGNPRPMPHPTPCPSRR